MDISNRFHSSVLMVTDAVSPFINLQEPTTIWEDQGVRKIAWWVWAHAEQIPILSTHAKRQISQVLRSGDIPAHCSAVLGKWAMSSDRGPACVKAIRKRIGEVTNTKCLPLASLHSSTQKCVHHTHIYRGTSGRHNIRNGRQNRQNWQR